jgi:hypothetical protein
MSMTGSDSCVVMSAKKKKQKGCKYFVSAVKMFAFVQNKRRDVCHLPLPPPQTLGRGGRPLPFALSLCQKPTTPPLHSTDS